ncbi:MAG: polysaccharide deacetylase family protein [bacterium]
MFARYSRFDKNVNIRNKHFKFLVKRLADYATLGIHPSYYSIENPNYLSFETGKLSEVLNQDVSRSRQQFLRLMLPDTYRNLLENDITDDYTMGYAALPGFRAGICSTYSFYDLDREEETKLRIHPFAVMDGTLKDYLNLTPDEAIDQIKRLIFEVKKVNGTFISLWHNESLSDLKRWKGWRRVYEELLEMAAG